MLLCCHNWPITFSAWTDMICDDKYSVWALVSYVDCHPYYRIKLNVCTDLWCLLSIPDMMTSQGCINKTCASWLFYIWTFYYVYSRYGGNLKLSYILAHVWFNIILTIVDENCFIYIFWTCVITVDIWYLYLLAQHITLENSTYKIYYKKKIGPLIV